MSCSEFSKEGFQVFTIECYAGCGFVINGFIMLRDVPHCAHSGRNFYHNWMLNFVKCFSASVEMTVVFVFSFLMWYITEGFACIEPLCDSG